MKKKRPSLVWHMASWGSVSGTVLALFYITIMVDFVSSANDLSALAMLFSPFMWALSAICGGLPGAIMGALVATRLWRFFRDIPIPFTKEHMREKRLPVYVVAFSMTMILSILLLLFVFGFATLLSPLGISALIAGVASTYVAHRYMWRLRLWSGGVDSRKSKAKNDALNTSRLEDPRIINDTQLIQHETVTQSEKIL